MKTACSLCFFMLVIFGLCPTSHAEDWQFFFNSNGIKYFYDKDSIAYPDKNTVQVWCKELATDEAYAQGVKLKQLQELKEVDCTRRRYKVLVGRVSYIDRPVEELVETSWFYSEPGALNDAFYRAVCPQRKQRNVK